MRRSSAIRCLAASKNSTRIAAALFEQRVQVWDLRSGTTVCDFNTVFSFGGSRLALDSSGERCVAAGWNGGRSGGVACYETATGKQMWHRLDLRHIQRVRSSSTSGAFWCIPDSGRTRLLDSADGKELDFIVGLRDLFDSDYSKDLLLEKSKGDYILKNGKPRNIPRLTSAILDATFGTQSVAISESGGPVRCIDSSTGKELWMFLPQKDSHVLNLWFRNADRNFYGVVWNYQRGGFRQLVKFDAESGKASTLCNLDSWEEAYCPKLDCIVASNGELIELSKGTLLNRLGFPLKDYAD
jgi:outer membrane protein assembly factor BamB